jgi:hypothetical protein
MDSFAPKIAEKSNILFIKCRKMDFQPFIERYREIAINETRTISYATIGGTYYQDLSFIPLYCNKKDCDCRRAMVQVIDPLKSADPLAIISYGWEPLSFYKAWGRGMSAEMVKEFKGPALDFSNPQSNPHPEFVELFKHMLEDGVYAKRYPRQYAQFKLKIGMKLPKDVAPYLGLMQPCGCKSGEIFKFCCAPKNWL